MGKKSKEFERLIHEIKSSVYNLEMDDFSSFDKCPEDLFEILAKKLDMAAILINEVDETEF